MAKSKEMVYYAKKKKVCFTIPVYKRSVNGDVEKNANGQPIRVVKRHASGEPKYTSAGQPDYMVELKTFSTQSANVKMGFLCSYRTSDPYEIDVLKKLVEDPTSSVITEDQLKAQTNSAAYQEERKRIEVERENDKLQTEVERLTAELASAKGSK